MQLQVLEGPLPPVVRVKPINDAEPIEDLDFTPVPGVASPFEEVRAKDEKFSPRPGEPVEALSEQVCEAQNEISKHEGQTADSVEITESFEAAEIKVTEFFGEPAAPVVESGLEAPTPEAPTVPEAAKPTPAKPKTPKAEPQKQESPKPGTPKPKAPSPADIPPKAPADTEEHSEVEAEIEDSRPKIPSPSMMAPRRKLRSRYVPLPNEVWATAGFQTPYDVGQQYASWWFENAATSTQRDQAHLLSGGGLPPEIDRPLLQFACETLHEYTLTEAQRVALRDGFHSGIRGVLLNQRDS